ncbi:hypothetical protein [Auritidibacter ignavus]|uniref:hypothetical protein n=1 Tax=Auritidibacter ignavus TaxID=678932 RepID=UPI0024497B1D|nr:hypothetical protein [Auritidibacter ignavus]WGH82931.1 hypothetical protein QDX20_06440 [Auritidibacter ignavus]
MSTTARERSREAGVNDKGLSGVFARLRAGKDHGWGIFHQGSWPMMIGGMMLIVSAFLPWVSLPWVEGITGDAFHFRGTDGPGVLTLAVGCLSFAGAFVPRRKLAIGHAAVPGVVVALIVLLQCWNIVAYSIQLDAWGALLPGMGLVLAGGGAVVLMKAGWNMYRRWPVKA